MEVLEDRDVHWFGPVDEDAVLTTEEALGVPLPSEYRGFVLKYGSGLVDHLELFGLGGPEASAPNLVWLVSRLDSEGFHRPHQLIPFHAEGDGDYAAVLAAPLSGNARGSVVYWSPRRDDVLDVRAGAPGLEAWLNERLQES